MMLLLSVLKAALEYDIWYNKNDKEVVGIWEAENSKQKLTTFTEIVDELAGAAGKKTMKFKVNGEDKKYDVVDDYKDIINNAITSKECAVPFFIDGIELIKDTLSTLLASSTTASSLIEFNIIL